MSFSDRLPRLFLEPLLGKTTAVRVEDRPSNLKFAAAVIRLLLDGGPGCRLIDLDAAYSSNLDALTAGVPRERLAALDITMPIPGSDASAFLPAIFLVGDDKPLLIDSANSLYQLLSAGNPRAANRKFTFLVSALSVWSKSNGRPTIASIYDRRPPTHRRATRSLADVFDNSVSLSIRHKGLSFKCERGAAWRGGSFFLPFEEG